MEAVKKNILHTYEANFNFNKKFYFYFNEINLLASQKKDNHLATVTDALSRIFSTTSYRKTVSPPLLSSHMETLLYLLKVFYLNLLLHCILEQM